EHEEEREQESCRQEGRQQERRQRGNDTEPGFRTSERRGAAPSQRQLGIRVNPGRVTAPRGRGTFRLLTQKACLELAAALHTASKLFTSVRLERSHCARAALLVLPGAAELAAATQCVTAQLLVGGGRAARPE